MHVCKKLILEPARIILFYCWKCSCTQKKSFGDCFLLQRRNRATTALKDLGFVFGENAIAEEDFCPAGSLGQIHQVTKLTLTFSENVVRIQETEYTPRTVPAQLLILERKHFYQS